jgi:hypothetical protein
MSDLLFSAYLNRLKRDQLIPFVIRLMRGKLDRRNGVNPRISYLILEESFPLQKDAFA